jgi:RNA polymerase sigma-70 factor (ECF subfamily)
MSDPDGHSASKDEPMDQKRVGLSDAALVVAVGRYDEEALRELYRRHGDAVYGLANRVICDRHIAEEVLQDTFVRLWNNPERYDPERGSLRTYLLRITHGRSVDRIRSEQARRDREERHEVDLATTTPPADIEREAWELIRSSNIRDALEELSTSERDAIVLAYFGGHTYREVADKLSIPEGTAKSRIRLGLAKLASHLEVAGLGVQT